MQAALELPWTGERFIPQSVAGDTALEHLHRYALAQQLARGKRVLDVACGEGYGSFLLAEHAVSVIGVDLAPEAVAHASSTYRRENLQFLAGNCTQLPLPDACMDVAISFETLEHHAEHEAMLRELRRVLTPEGVLLISTPERHHYSTERNYRNPFHVLELSEGEFRQLLARHFAHAAYYAQRVVYASLAVPCEGTSPFVSFSGSPSELQQQDGLSAPLYLMALASAGPLPRLPASQFDGSKEWERENQRLLDQLGQTKNQLASTQLQLSAVYASVYWRLSYPLRMLRNLLRQVAGI